MTTLEKLQWLVEHSEEGVLIDTVHCIGRESQTDITFTQAGIKRRFAARFAVDAIDAAYDHLNKP